MPTPVLVALGGALGALARWGIGVGMVRWLGPGVPWGTWVANVAGCFLIGVALPLLHETHPQRALAVVGFLGAFTTFSTYTAETLLLWESGETALALVNAAGSVVVGLVACGLGLWVGRGLA
ncbi:MAG: CrcB family protein [Bacteroidota bacterium]